MLYYRIFRYYLPNLYSQVDVYFYGFNFSFLFSLNFGNRRAG
jgi:hypothetical protein